VIPVLDAWRSYLIIKEGNKFISAYQRITGINSMELVIAICILLDVGNLM